MIARLFALARRTCLLLTIVLVAGCASPTGPAQRYDPYWSGRLALRVASEPAQAFAAAFELRGSPDSGSLTLTSALGITLARLEWGSQGARLAAQGSVQQFDTLDTLTAHVTGAALPMASLFDWLQGVQPATPGWQVDLSSLSDGRLNARRFAPEPTVELKLLLER